MADRFVHRLMAAALAWSWAQPAAAHHVDGAATGGAALVAVALALLLATGALLYGIGLRKLWKKAGVGRGIRIPDVARFTLGWLTLGMALLGPIDEMAERSFSLHMVQHELLMVVAAPLIVLGRPLEAWAWGAPVGVRRAVATAVRAAPLRRLWDLLGAPVGAWTFHALALWVWHLPALFLAALASLPMHCLQHACFFASALGFWWVAFGGIARASNAASIASLFTTMLHTSALGALLTFAPTPWYAHGGPLAFGLSPLEDQQLGGLVMWIPGGFAYMVAGLVVVGAWLGRPEQSPSRMGRTG
jgi:putative membrane protein